MDVQSKVMAMESWIETARQAVNRSPQVREELRGEAKKMLEEGERDAARRIFVDILEEPMPDVSAAVAGDIGKQY